MRPTQLLTSTVVVHFLPSRNTAKELSTPATSCHKKKRSNSHMKLLKFKSLTRMTVSDCIENNYGVIALSVKFELLKLETNYCSNTTPKGIYSIPRAFKQSS